jgi:hypothetical protein
MYIPRPFLGHGSVNTFPFLGTRPLIMQQLDYSNGRAVFSMWSVQICYKQLRYLVDSSVLYGNLWKKDLSLRERNSHFWSRYQETSSNRLKTLPCVLSGIVVTICKWSINLFTNPNPRRESHTYTWQYNRRYLGKENAFYSEISLS